MNRLLSRREKDGHAHKREKSRDKSSSDKKTEALSGDGVISLFKFDPNRKLDKEQAAKIHTMKQRLHDGGYINISDQQIHYGLFSKHADGDVNKALELVILFQESVEGVIKPYDPSIHMLGADNKEGVTCWLDSLLFSMFARLGSFEPILYTIYDDEPRRRLSTLIRLWVNMLRTGILIRTDVTSYLQEALAECGWKEAGKMKQQDVSEAFGFITETLQLPLLSLKMNLFHEGKMDAKDDHKLVHERLLEVAVPPDPENGQPIQLEDCLESYFNNRVEVVRHLSGLERSNTMSSVRTTQSDKGRVLHVEVSEMSTPDTPASSYPPSTPISPTGSRHRATSIVIHRIIQEDEQGEPSTDGDNMSTRASIRKASIRKEVLMPAWQFFNLIPWYTKSSMTSDSSVIANFSNATPVLGICLKRYAMSPTGRAVKQKTFIDIPLEIGLPHFIKDDTIEEEGPLMGNFKLSLQSVICHEGDSLNEGHYIAYIRGTTQVADGDVASDRRLSDSSQPPHYPVDRWIKHNDLMRTNKVQYVDIEAALKNPQFTPYLLFYQVLPTYDDSAPSDLECEPPSYDYGVSMTVTESTPQIDRNPYHALFQQPQGYFDGVKDDFTPAISLSSEIDKPRQSISLSSEIGIPRHSVSLSSEIGVPRQSISLSSEIDRPRQSITLPEDRRGSIAFTEASLGSTTSSIRGPEFISAPVTPAEETTAQRLSRAASRFRKSGSKSRPTSSSGENRISATFSRLSLRSKEQLNKDYKAESSKDHSTLPIPNSDGTTEPHEPAHNAVSFEEVALKPPAPGPIDTTPTRKVSKRGRKRDKSKEPSVKAEESHHHHHHKGKGKEKGKGELDRQCTIM